jgi:hypothetical protein
MFETPQAVEMVGSMFLGFVLVWFLLSRGGRSGRDAPEIAGSDLGLAEASTTSPDDSPRAGALGPGMRVEYVGPVSPADEPDAAPRPGELGTILEMAPDDVTVRWDRAGTFAGELTFNLHPITSGEEQGSTAAAEAGPVAVSASRSVA